MEIKQTEYNFLLQSKEQEIKVLEERILNINESIESIKRDRLRDQKTIRDYESELKLISSRMAEINENKTDENFKNFNTHLKLEV